MMLLMTFSVSYRRMKVLYEFVIVQQFVAEKNALSKRYFESVRAEGTAKVEQMNIR